MEMEEEGVGKVLAKATELKLKINHCISNSTNADVINIPSTVDDDDERYEEETERLLNIRDAFESLESQLSALQDLQQKQQYEKEVALSEIDYSRKMLLQKLKEYKGEDLEVIHEASSFAAEKVEHNTDLLLPPYINHTSQAIVLDNGHMSRSRPLRKSIPNGTTENNVNQRRGLGRLISTVARTVLPILGVVYVLSLSDSRLQLGKGFNFSGLLQKPQNIEKRRVVECPPGKVLVMEDERVRCVVKERIEIPFESHIAKPDVNYGCG
ncbi:hypothetical protein ACFE04_021646 [Oxalis oulophora]